MRTALVILKVLPASIPLEWVLWDSVGRIHCRLLTPEDTAQRQQLLTLFFGRTSLACLLHDPREDQWYAFDAFLTSYAVMPAFEVILQPAGEIQRLAASPSLTYEGAL